ncbi:MAG: hypothetical protein AB7F50_06460 [Fimbriimonadaceae bacterium]
MLATIACAICMPPTGRQATPQAVARWAMGLPRVSAQKDRPLLPTGIVRGGPEPTTEETRAMVDALNNARAARLAPLLATVSNEGPDVALEAAREHRRRFAGLEDEYIVDPMIVRLLVELDREREALLEMEQSESVQLSLIWQSGSDIQALYAYLNARAGTVWRPYWSSWLEANRSGRRSFDRLLGERDPWYRPDFVPTAPDTLALSSLTLVW